MKTGHEYEAWLHTPDAPGLMRPVSQAAALQLVPSSGMHAAPPLARFGKAAPEGLQAAGGGGHGRLSGWKGMQGECDEGGREERTYEDELPGGERDCKALGEAEEVALRAHDACSGGINWYKVASMQARGWCWHLRVERSASLALQSCFLHTVRANKARRATWRR